jgi:hypothetical protein
MMNRFNTACQHLWTTAKAFPVEMLLGLTFFVLSVVYNSQEGSHNDVRFLFFQLFVVTYLLHQYSRDGNKLIRGLYYVSYLFFIPLLFLDLSSFIDSYSYGFSWALAVLLLFIGKKEWDNQKFVNSAIHNVVDIVISVGLSLLFVLAFLAIWRSVMYIFDISEDHHLFVNVLSFIGFVFTPLIYCDLQNKEHTENEPLNKLVRFIINFILSPSVIIYTAILLFYFVMIAIRWDLPKGGIGYMVMAYITIALVGVAVQESLTKRYYDWFYRYFTWISLPPLLLMWIGTVYRIRLYGFTESRVYLIAAGLVMAAFVFMLLWRSSHRYRLMVIIACAGIVVTTYIPGISAKQIGLNSQKERFENITSALYLMDGKTHRLKSGIDIEKLSRDTTMAKKLKEVTSIYYYLVAAQGQEMVRKEYGNWEYDNTDDVCVEDTGYTPFEWKSGNVNVEGYNILLSPDSYKVTLNTSSDIIVSSVHGGNTMIVYPLGSQIAANKKAHNNVLPDVGKPLYYRNDSLLVVVKTVALFSDNMIKGKPSVMVFRKSDDAYKK